MTTENTARVEEGEGLALQYCSCIHSADLAKSLTSVVVSSERNLLFCASKGQIAVFDTVTSARQHLIPIPGGHTPTLLKILPGGSRLVIVCAEWTIYLHSLDALKTTPVLNLAQTKKSKLFRPVLTSISLGLTSTEQPLQVLFVTNIGKDSLRTVHLGMKVERDKGKIQKEVVPGFKLPLMKGKGVVALASHPFCPCIMLLTVNGELQGYNYENSALVSCFQYSMLINDVHEAGSKDEGKLLPQVVGSHLQCEPHPCKPDNALVMIFLPRQGTFYIMEHAVGASPTPFMKNMWGGIDIVLTMDLCPASGALVAIAGRLGGRYRMRAWNLVGSKAYPAKFALVERPCNQRVSELLVSEEASTVYSQPDWAKLWDGEPQWGSSITKTEFLDLASAASRGADMGMAASALPVTGHLLTGSNMLAVRYQGRATNSPNAVQPSTPLTLFRLIDHSHPTMCHPSGRCGQLHSTPQAWGSITHPEGEDAPVYQFPHAAYYLDGLQLKAYMSAPQESRIITELPSEDSEQRTVNPDTILYSRGNQTCLIFCSVIQDQKQRVFTQIDVSLEEQVHAWYGTGVMGTYLGPRDTFFAVLESTNIGEDNIAIYATVAPPPLPPLVEDESGAEPLPEARYPAARAYCELGLGDCVKGLWAGPPATFALEEAVYDVDGNVLEAEEVEGSGMVVLSTKRGSLMLALLPAVAEDGIADEMEEMPQIVPQYQIQLMEGERVLQVAWNTMVLAEAVGYPSHCLGAILTTHRVCIVSGNFTMLQSTPIAEPALGCTHTITSLLWTGPALLLCHSAGRVEQLHFNGKRTHICSLPRLGTYVLMAAYGDRLVLGHEREGDWVVVVRRVTVAALVVQGWLSLLSTNHPFAPWNVVRLQLQHLFKHYNMQTSSDAAMAEALLTAGCGDLAITTTEQFVEASGISKAAHAAASGSWDHATKQVIDDYKLSAYAPCAPPEGSALRKTLITVGLGAMSQGKWSCAEQCLRTAGEHLLLLLLFSLQHNRIALEEAAKEGSSNASHTLAFLLMAADSNIGLRNKLQYDWSITRHQMDTPASTWAMAESLYPPMRAIAPEGLKENVLEGEEAPIIPLDIGSLAAHLGLPHHEMLNNAQVVAPVGEGEGDGSKPLPGKEDEEAVEEEEPEEDVPELTEEEKEQEKAREAFMADFKGDSLFDDDSDAEEGDGESGLIDLGDDAPKKTPRFKIQIKDSTFVAGATGADVAEAVKKLALGPPGSVSMAALQKKTAPVQPVTDPWADMGMDAPKQDTPPQSEKLEPTAEEEDPFAAFGDMALASPENSAKLEQVTKEEEDGPIDPENAPGFQEGVAAMFGGQWAVAEQHLTKAYNLRTGMKRRQYGQYLAVVVILSLYDRGADVATRISRFAAGLPLIEFDHAAFLVNDAVRRNAIAGNQLWPRSRMTAFVDQAQRIGRQDVAVNAQSVINMLMAQAGPAADVSVPVTEDIPGFVNTVNAAVSPDAIKGCVMDLL